MIPIAKPIIGEEEIKAVEEVLRSGIIAKNKKADEFEEKFADYIGVSNAVAVSSGTAALHCALLACGIGAGDEVITTPFSFSSTGDAILFVGATPVFVDIDLFDFNISASLIEEKITPKTKAILIVHLFGQPCNMTKIMKICKKYNLQLIEDSAQAHGATFNNEKVGSFGVGCFSFYATKNMVTGEGGMVTTNDEHIAKMVKMIRNHGQEYRYYSRILGYNYQMTDIEAAIGICQLEKLPSFNKKRQENAMYYNENLELIHGLMIPMTLGNIGHVYHQYTLKIDPKLFGMNRNQLKEELSKKGIGSEMYYPITIPAQESYKNLGFQDDCEIAKLLASQVLSLPIHPSVTKEDLDYIIESIKEIQKGI